MSKERKNPSPKHLNPNPNSLLIPDEETFIRMNLPERIQHWILIITFFTLIITGFPSILYEFKFFKSLFSIPGSFYFRGILHRIAAVVFIVNIIWHILYTIFTQRGRNNFREILPRRKDFKDAFELFWYNLGLTRFLYRKGIFKKFFQSHPYWLFQNPPQFGRYNFIEKFEYWAVAWGGLLMIVSGFFMWFEEFSLSLFPLWVHDIFVIIHGYEAILAFLAVIIWHMYNVHLNPENFPMSKIWLNGKITGKELRILHPLEYKKILEDRKKKFSSKD